MEVLVSGPGNTLSVALCGEIESTASVIIESAANAAAADGRTLVVDTARLRPGPSAAHEQLERALEDAARRGRLRRT